MSDLLQMLGAAGDFVAALATFAAALCRALLPWLPGGLWCAWWLWCVNWRKAWPTLARGGWVVAALFTLVAALAWSALFPARWERAGVTVPNFWWQLGACTALALVALFCGWLQGRLGWTPDEVVFDPPVDHDPHAHGHHAPVHGGHHLPAHGGHH